MEYLPLSPPHDLPFENFIDTQRYAGHTSEGGPLPAYLLVNKFETTPGTFDEHSYYDFSRRELADFRPDPPLFENETPRDTKKWSKTRMNMLHFGSRSGADPANHPEMFYGFLDQDTRTPGDDHVPAWRIAQQQAARAHYLKPSEPEGATHLSEAIPGDVAPETEVYKKLNKARYWAARNVHMFERSLQDDRMRGGRTQQPLPCAASDQTAEASARGSASETVMRGQRRREYDHDEGSGMQREARRREASELAALRAAQACAMVDGDVEDLTGAAVERRSAMGAPARRHASARSAETARMFAHRARGPSEPVAEVDPTQGQRGGVNLRALAEHMAAAASVARVAGGDGEMEVDMDPVAGGVQRPRAWHLDDGDPLALLHRESMHDAERKQEIFEIATQLASRTTLGPQSLPHLAIDHRATDSGGAWAGGVEMGRVDDSMPSYLVVDALLMKRACERPSDLSMIRRKMVTDARKPTFEEMELANQTAGMLKRVRSATVMASKTMRDMEMASDALMLHNAKQRSMGEAPASWHHAHDAMMEETHLAAPVFGPACTPRAPARERPCANVSMLRAVGRAARVEQMERGRAGDHVVARKSDAADGIEEEGELMRGAPSARFAREQGPSMRSLVLHEDMNPDRLGGE